MNDLFDRQPDGNLTDGDEKSVPSGSPRTTTRRPDGTLVPVFKATEPNDPSVGGRRSVVRAPGRRPERTEQKRDAARTNAAREFEHATTENGPCGTVMSSMFAGACSAQSTGSLTSTGMEPQPSSSDGWELVTDAQPKSPQPAQAAPRSSGRTAANGAGAKAKPQKDTKALRAERDLLRLQLADWRQSLDLRARALAPMQGAFLAAHEKAADVAAFYGPPPRECPMARARVLEAYEVRRKASMAAHPYRQAVAEAERVVKGISARIKEINTELEHG